MSLFLGEIAGELVNGGKQATFPKVAEPYPLEDTRWSGGKFSLSA